RHAVRLRLSAQGQRASRLHGDAGVAGRALSPGDKGRGAGGPGALRFGGGRGGSPARRADRPSRVRRLHGQAAGRDQRRRAPACTRDHAARRDAAGPVRHRATRAVTERGRLARLLLAAAGAWLTAMPAVAQVQRRNVAQLPFADGVIVIDAHSDGRVVIGAAHGDSTAIVSLPAHAAQEWADSVAHLLATRVRATPRQRADRRVVDDPETGAGISFTRYALRGALRYRLFF